MASPSDYDSNQFISLIYDQGPRIGLELSDSFLRYILTICIRKLNRKNLFQPKYLFTHVNRNIFSSQLERGIPILRIHLLIFFFAQSTCLITARHIIFRSRD